MADYNPDRVVQSPYKTSNQGFEYCSFTLQQTDIAGWNIPHL